MVRSPPAGVVALTDVHSVGDQVPADEAGRVVQATGTFDPDRQALVVDREHDGRAGCVGRHSFAGTRQSVKSRP